MENKMGHSKLLAAHTKLKANVFMRISQDRATVNVVRRDGTHVETSEGH